MQFKINFENFPISSGFMIAFYCFVSCYLLAETILIFKTIPILEHPLIKNIIGPAFGALAGAFLAFYLNRIHQEKRDKQIQDQLNIDALRNILHVFGTKLLFYKQFTEDFSEAKKYTEGNTIPVIPISISEHVINLKYNLSELAFLDETNIELRAMLVEEEQLFNKLVFSILQGNEVIQNALHDELGKTKRLKYLDAYRLSEALIELSLMASLNKTCQAYASLEKETKNQYPSEKFTSFKDYKSLMDFAANKEAR